MKDSADAGLLTLDENSFPGHAALLKELGPAGYLRFLQQYIGGMGDYTKERQRWIDKVDLSDLDWKFGGKKKVRSRK